MKGTERNKTYARLCICALPIIPEDGFLAGSKDSIENENNEVTIVRQDGGDEDIITFDGWE